MTSKLKDIKRSFTYRQWKSYKKKFADKQMRLIFSKIALIIQPHLSIKELIICEKLMLKSDLSKQELMFALPFGKMEHLTSFKANWAAFGKFMFYIYQTSTYWRDHAKHKANVFNKDNYIAKNALKRQHYYEWLYSIDLTTWNYNDIIMKVMKKVF